MEFLNNSIALHSVAVFTSCCKCWHKAPLSLCVPVCGRLEQPALAPVLGFLLQVRECFSPFFPALLPSLAAAFPHLVGRRTLDLGGWGLQAVTSFLD